jgi:hypothetical protein
MRCRAVAMRHKEQCWLQAEAAVVAELDGVGSCFQKRGKPLRLHRCQLDLARFVPRPADADDYPLSGPRPDGVKESPFIVIEVKRRALGFPTHAANLPA